MFIYPYGYVSLFLPPNIRNIVVCVCVCVCVYPWTMVHNAAGFHSCFICCSSREQITWPSMCASLQHKESRNIIASWQTWAACLPVPSRLAVQSKSINADMALTSERASTSLPHVSISIHSEEYTIKRLKTKSIQRIISWLKKHNRLRALTSTSWHPIS